MILIRFSLCRLVPAALTGYVLLATPDFCLDPAWSAASFELSGADITVGSYAGPPPGELSRLRFASFNLHGPPTRRIDRMIEILRVSPPLKDAVVLALQEVNRDHAGSGHRDVARELAMALKAHFAYAVELPHGRGGGVRGLAILSRFPLSDVKRILLPEEGPAGRRRIALAATADFGEWRLRLYNLHLETKISKEKRGEQILRVLGDSESFQGVPTVILGDFNTAWSGSRNVMFELMQGAGFVCPFRENRKTFQSKWLIRLKLDWIWTRHLRVLDSGVEESIQVSDHRPIWIDIEPLRSQQDLSPGFRRPGSDGWMGRSLDFLPSSAPGGRVRLAGR